MADRKNIMLGTAGHVDHGKTALVKILTGCNTDTLAEEQKRGLTIDLGFAPCQMADQRIVGIVDVPGHVDFIRNMVAGAHGIDVVIFVVAADDGVMPQTREHLDILTLMGTRGGIVALTKIDLVASEMRELAIEDVRRLLGGTFLADAPICPISNITGEGYEGLFAALNAAVAACPERQTGGLFRMWVEDVYAIRGFGTVATGIPLTGQVAVGDHLRLLPEGRELRVRKLEVYGQEAPIGRAGECVAVNVSGAEAGEIGRGMVLCQGEFQAVSMAEAQLRLLGHFPRALKDYTELHLHVGTGETTARVALLEGKELAPGQSAMAQLRLREPMALAAGDRFVIRADLGGPTAGRLTTIGGGRILSTLNQRLRRNRPWTLEALAERAAALDHPRAWAEANLKQSPEPMSAQQLASAAGMTLPQVEPLLAEMAHEGAAKPVAAGTYIHARSVELLAQRAKEKLDEFHAANPLRVGMEEAELAKTLQVEPALLRLAVDLLASRGEAQRKGAMVKLAGRGPKISMPEQELCEKIVAALREAHLAPPLAAELAAMLKVEAKPLTKLLLLLADQGEVVQLEADKLFMHRQAVEAAQKVAMDLFARNNSFETVEFRDALGVSRKYAVPLLDYFDTLRLTARSGSRRTPGALARQRLAEQAPKAAEPPRGNPLA